MTYEVAVGLVAIDSFFGNTDRNDGGSYFDASVAIDVPIFVDVYNDVQLRFS